MTSFTETFGGSPVSPAEVAYAAYSFSADEQLYWPQFSAGQTNVAARFMSITATVASINVIMPDATLNSVGYDAIVFNAGTNSFNVVNYGSGAIVTIAPGQTYYLMLTSNATQNGDWQVIQFGVGTGSAVSSQLAGPGLLAYAGLLQVNLNAINASNSFSLTAAGLAQFYVWTGGAGTITLPSAASVGNGFFFMVANNGSGSLTIAPSSGTIDENSTSVFSQTQSGFIMSNGSNWFTVGKGIQNTFAVTLLNLNVAGGANITETTAQAQNIIQNFTGLLTANIAVIVPTTVQIYFVSNNTTGPYTLTVKTVSGTGISVSQGSTAILYCDGINVLNAFTATVSGSLVLSDGSAISPSLSFTAQPGTGLYSAGSNTMSVTANTTQVMQFAAESSAVNYFGVVATSSGVAPTLGVAGSDANINIAFVPKGTGYVTAGFIDNTVIGSNIASTGTFTTLTATTVTANTGTFSNSSGQGTVTINSQAGSGFGGFIKYQSGGVNEAYTGLYSGVVGGSDNTDLIIQSVSGQVILGAASHTSDIVIGTSGGVTLGSSLIVSGSASVSSSISVIGHTTFEGVTSTGATGTGNLVYSISPIITGTGTANFNTATISTLNVSGVLTASGGIESPSMNGGQLAGLRNRIINGDMRVDQRNSGSSQTITAGVGFAYTIDRFIANSTGANVAGQRIAGSAPDQYLYQFTGASSVTSIGFGQRIEATNVADLAGTTVTLSCKIANSLLTAITWTAYYANSADNWSGSTLIAMGAFTVTSSLATYSTQISLPANAINGIMILLDVGAQTSGTWQITEFQLENGTLATPFERRPIGLETVLCERYFEYLTTQLNGTFASSGTSRCIWSFKVQKRVTPTMVYSGGSSSQSNLGMDAAVVGSGSGTEAVIAGSSTASAEL